MPDVGAIKVIRVIDEQTIDANNGKPVQQVRVDFMVGNHGPFIERFPKETFDPSIVNAKLADFKSKLDTLTSS